MADRGNKDRKMELERKKLIKCGHCPYHRNENQTRADIRASRTDKGKNHRRGGK